MWKNWLYSVKSLLICVRKFLGGFICGMLFISGYGVGFGIGISVCGVVVVFLIFIVSFSLFGRVSEITIILLLLSWRSI